MAGHSKWANIRHKKAKEDLKRAKVFTKLTREITIAAREGGEAVESNARLALAVDNAKAANVPKDKIQKAIDKGAGKDNKEGETFTEVSYEGYGPGGVAFILEGTSNNVHRTAGEVRHLFSKGGGNLGETGSVNYLFETKGRLEFATEAEDEWPILETLEDYLVDVELFEGRAEVLTARDELMAVKNVLINAGITVESAELVRVPMTTVDVEEETYMKNIELYQRFEENMDISSIYWNLSSNEEFEQKYFQG